MTHATTTDWIIVELGRKGEIAKTVQYLLCARGHNVAVDGNVGPQTQAAIKAFQSANGLTPDGSVGNQTWPKLIVQVAQGAKGHAVKAAQSQLRLRNLYETKNLQVDGDFGPKTSAGVKAFQQMLNDQGYVSTLVDGIVGHDTWFALANNYGGPDL